MTPPSAAAEEVAAIPADLRDELVRNHLVPLWESPTAHKTDVASERAHVWSWASTSPVMRQVGKIGSPKVVERRVLSLVNPASASPEDEATTGAISATLQMLLPGERARPHRHSMSALRFVLEGSGARTVVDGRLCPMEPGDLIITPAWTWHEHVSDGDAATIWVDVLDVALHLALGTESFQPGPITELPAQLDEAAFAVPAVLPALEKNGHDYSPVFRYPRGNVERALAAAPRQPDGSRRVQYVNPLSGGPAMALLDCSMMELEQGSQTLPRRSRGSMVCVVTQGQGTAQIADEVIEWSEKDLFTIPRGDQAEILTQSGPARIFTVDNAAVYDRLGVGDVP